MGKTRRQGQSPTSPCPPGLAQTGQQGALSQTELTGTHSPGADVSFTWPGVQQTLDHEGRGNVLVPQSLHLSNGMITLLPWVCTRALLVSCKMLPCVHLLLSLCRKLEIRVQKKKSKPPIFALGAVQLRNVVSLVGGERLGNLCHPVLPTFSRTAASIDHAASSPTGGAGKPPSGVGGWGGWGETPFGS